MIDFIDVIVDDSVPTDSIEVRDAVTWSTAGRIINVDNEEGE